MNYKHLSWIGTALACVIGAAWYAGSGVDPKVRRVFAIEERLSQAVGSDPQQAELERQYTLALSELSAGELYEYKLESRRRYINRLTAFFNLPPEQQTLELDKSIDARRASEKASKQKRAVTRRKHAPTSADVELVAVNVAPDLPRCQEEMDLRVRYHQALMDRELTRFKK